MLPGKSELKDGVRIFVAARLLVTRLSGKRVHSSPAPRTELVIRESTARV